MSIVRLCPLVLLCSALLVPLARADDSVHNPEEGVNWEGLLKQSGVFLSIEHGFRFSTERATRHNSHRMSFRGYSQSLGNMHGWADGDPFYVNYVGHPMQGAATGFIWAQNDRRYRKIEFGRNPAYWRSRLRAGAFMWAYSEQFELGPFSEASIGHIQRDYPQQGFVDHAVTPAIGLGWMVTEDAIDKYIIKRFENRFQNPWARLFVRTGLNPTRTLANAVAFRTPWYRDSREGILSFRRDEPHDSYSETKPEKPEGVAPFEFNLTSNTMWYRDGTTCLGGGSSASFRVAESVQMMVDVSGCKLLGQALNFSGDSLLYLTGPRWNPSPAGRLSPHVEVLVGGQKITTEEVSPERKKALQELAPGADAAWLYSQYARQKDVSGAAVAFGGGVNLNVNNALALRLADFQYVHSWLPVQEWTGTYRWSAGLVLRMGTW